MKHFCSFSEAIREGAKLTGQAFGYGVSPDGRATCAWGAGVHAITGSLERKVYDSCDPLKIYPYLKLESACPVEGCRYGQNALYLVVYHLNDCHSWGREAIADWLESEEEKLGFVTVVEPECALESAKAGA